MPFGSGFIFDKKHCGTPEDHPAPWPAAEVKQVGQVGIALGACFPRPCLRQTEHVHVAAARGGGVFVVGRGGEALDVAAAGNLLRVNSLLLANVPHVHLIAATTGRIENSPTIEAI